MQNVPYKGRRPREITTKKVKRARQIVTDRGRASQKRIKKITGIRGEGTEAKAVTSERREGTY